MRNGTRLVAAAALYALAPLSPEDLAQKGDDSRQRRGSGTSGKQGSAVISARHRHKALDAYVCFG
ncbi:MAG TPA: hypothetical protein VKB62_00260, partial [Streptosporangiaceae bacterium]|nr:hypothetical protein [Streptosporangiaceae bacterium]